MISFSAIPAIFPSTCYALVQIVQTSFQAPGRPSRGGSHRACRAPGPESAYGANRKLRSAAAPLSRPGRRSTSGLTSSKKSSAAGRSLSRSHCKLCVQAVVFLRGGNHGRRLLLIRIPSPFGTHVSTVWCRNVTDAKAQVCGLLFRVTSIASEQDTTTGRELCWQWSTNRVLWRGEPPG